MRVYSGIKWAFEYVDRLLVLEDDLCASIFISFTAIIRKIYKMMTEYRYNLWYEYLAFTMKHRMIILRLQDLFGVGQLGSGYGTQWNDLEFIEDSTQRNSIPSGFKLLMGRIFFK
jgi:hypothetical protein